MRLDIPMRAGVAAENGTELIVLLIRPLGQDPDKDMRCLLPVYAAFSLSLGAAMNNPVG